MSAVAPQRNTPAGDVLLLTAWFGLVTGLGEGALFFLLQRGQLLSWNRVKAPVASEILWVAPLVDLILFTVVGVVLTLLARALPRFLTTARAALVVSFLCAYDLLAVSGHIYHYALIVLAWGLAVAANPSFRRHQAPALRIVRRTLPALAVTTLLMFAAVETRYWLRERGAVDRLAAPSPGAANVLVLVVDTLRADHLSAYGYTRSTSPNLDQLAQRGVLFENAFATSSWTLPSHGSLITGRYPHEHQAELRPLDRRYPTIGAALRARGYRTGAFSGNLYYFNRYQGFGRGFIHFEDYFCSAGDAAMRTLYGREAKKYILSPLGLEDAIGRKRAPEINAAILRWVERPAAHPFFVFVNYMDTHDPYLPPEPYRHAFSQAPSPGGLLLSGAESYPTLTAAEIQGEIDAYDGAIAYTDHHIGQLLSGLQERGLLANTIVIVTSDHGEAFGEHGLFLHQNALYRELVRVPLIISRPGHVPAGLRVARPVSNVALPATVMDLIAADDQTLFPQTSLAPLWSNEPGPTDGPDPIAELAQFPFGPRQRPSRTGAMKTLITQHWQLITHEKLGSELYDWSTDPGQTDNLAVQPQLQSLVEQLATRLELATVKR